MMTKKIARIMGLGCMVFMMLFVSLFTFAACSDASEPEDLTVYNYTDIIIFMGQSNMAGRGLNADGDETIPCEEGHGYEYRAVTAPDELSVMEEPFGAYENNDALGDFFSSGAIKKTGGLVTSFCESYYQAGGVPVIGVSASVGSTGVSEWVEGSTYGNEAAARLQACVKYVVDETDFDIRNISMMWCQGENDASATVKGTTDYADKLDSVLAGMRSTELEGGHKLDKCYIVTPSECSSGSASSDKQFMIEYQKAMCTGDAIEGYLDESEYSSNYVLASTKLTGVPSEWRDDPHFYQGIYNVCGWDAGQRIAEYVKTGVIADEAEDYIEGEAEAIGKEYNLPLTNANGAVSYD